MKLYQFARQLHTNLKYVPRCELAQSNEVEQLQSFVRNAKKLLVITGAGTSTESGIPDYRSEGVGMYARTSVRPIQYQEFIRSADVRRSYWARNFIGWPYFESAQPNEAHLALSEWERKGKLHWLVTQNIDLLHQKAGSKRLTTLHGSSSGVVCLSCRSITDRWSFQEVLRQHNPEWHAQPILVSADSDAILTEEQVKGFQASPATVLLVTSFTVKASCIKLIQERVEIPLPLRMSKNQYVFEVGYEISTVLQYYVITSKKCWQHNL